MIIILSIFVILYVSGMALAYYLIYLDNKIRYNKNSRSYSADTIGKVIKISLFSWIAVIFSIPEIFNSISKNSKFLNRPVYSKKPEEEK